MLRSHCSSKYGILRGALVSQFHVMTRGIVPSDPFVCVCVCDRCVLYICVAAVLVVVGMCVFTIYSFYIKLIGCDSPLKFFIEWIGAFYL